MENFFFWHYLFDLKKYFFLFKYNTGRNLKNNLFNFIISKRRQFFFKFKKILLWTTLRMYLCDCADIHSLDSKKKKQLKNLFKSKKLFFDRIAMHKVVWFKEIFFKSKKLFFWCNYHFQTFFNYILELHTAKSCA